MYAWVLIKFICEIFSRIVVTFRDESNKPSSTMIGYSDATVTASNYLLVVRPKTLLATVP